MRVITRGVLLAAFALISTAASAQTADEIIEKAVVASGGRDKGTIAVLNQSPNKMNTVVTLDLSTVGAGSMTIEQRFDGTDGWATNSMQGETVLTSSQLDTWRNAIFPSPFLDYKARGTKIELTGKDNVGGNDAYALLMTPAKGPTSRLWIDAKTYQPVKSVTTVETAETGPLEHTVVLSDFREVDGVKVPFKFVGSSAAQTFTIDVTKVEHNVQADPARFAKPAK
jgi:outer membrane lipoprotein-sorting protein